MRITVGIVIQYLRTCVGEGSLRFSDIYFAIPEERRRVLQQIAGLPDRATERRVLIDRHSISQHEIDLFTSLRNAENVCWRSV
jgi:hypothetical protein